ncbi:hypothetical protein BZG36_03077 [Bifiguratus adelaidae]|uniref:Methyltransferase domain-containing protein n=1 Tax=Bifiguratus adelaidae TaxID=1938954 RepID=A0A261XZI1_9FUNG|nr:hypothetical protein BZG36_03077 [Bifiguratus adelaidae]
MLVPKKAGEQVSARQTALPSPEILTPVALSQLSAPSTPTSPGTSLSKPKFVYNELNRRFHNEEDSAYILPNDENEIGRLQELHYLMRWTLEGDFQAPIKEILQSGARVLDIGCGPGTWVMAMATAYPKSHFTGIGISPVFPDKDYPPNCIFQQANSIKGLPFPDNHFDFVYERMLEAGYTSSNWTFVLSEIKRVTKPGGWVELVEVDLTPRSAGPKFKHLINAVIEALKEKNLDVTIGRQISSLVEQCSDEPKASLVADYRSVPVNFAGPVGDMWANQLKLAIGATQPLFQAKYGNVELEGFNRSMQEAIDECTEFKTVVEEVRPFKTGTEKTSIKSVPPTGKESSAEPAAAVTTPPHKESSSIGTSPTSPNGSLREKPKFVWNEVNRRFHNEEDSAYVLPNDEGEVTRLQEFHYLTRWGLNGDFHAPVKEKLESGAQVLDIGCGPETWVLEMATEFPESHFTGIDISAIFPETIRPRNCDFLEANSLKGLPFPDNHFDFVYQRYLLGGYTAENWKFVLSEIKRVTKPGGWVELVELDSTVRNAGPLLKDLLDTMISATKAKGLDTTIGEQLSSLLEQCSDDPKPTLQVDYRSIPVGFDGRIGDMWANQMRTGFPGIQPLFETKYGKMTPEEFKQRIENALQEGADHQAYHNFFFGYVQVVKAKA